MPSTVLADPTTAGGHGCGTVEICSDAASSGLSQRMAQENCHWHWQWFALKTRLFQPGSSTALRPWSGRSASRPGHLPASHTMNRDFAEMLNALSAERVEFLVVGACARSDRPARRPPRSPPPRQFRPGGRDRAKTRQHAAASVVHAGRRLGDRRGRRTQVENLPSRGTARIVRDRSGCVPFRMPSQCP